ncbi:MAG: EF-hand domain-containing protein [Aestuariivirga sp.]
MRKALKLGALAVLAAAAGTMAAEANEPFVPRGERLFALFDTDKNGSMSKPEFLLRAEKRFLRADANSDGAVTAAEIDAQLAKAIERRRARMMANMDRDKDGSVTREELDKYVEAMFDGADANGDGGVSMDEARGFRLAKWRKSLESKPAN